MDIENVLSHIANGLRWPVLVLAVVALVAVIAELGSLIVELAARRRRPLRRLEEQLAAARTALGSGDQAAAKAALSAVAVNKSMAALLDDLLAQLPDPDAGERIAKRLADYDYRHVRRLERTRMLVRFGPALGLMGTLIPLSPALAGLAKGDVKTLSDNLQVAFSVTVVGLLVGAVAFAISLVRDRLYGQDFSDVQYAAATLTAPLAAPVPMSSAASESTIS